MSEKLDINELLVLENELKLMKIISNAIVTNRISLEEHYNFIVRDIIFFADKFKYNGRVGFVTDMEISKIYC